MKASNRSTASGKRAGTVPLFAHVGFDFGQFFADEGAAVVVGNHRPVVQPGFRVDPLPYLCARDLGRGGVFHQVVDGGGPIAP